MVTFMCDTCAATLKKNQVKNHQFQCRGAKVFTCVDCSQTFQGPQLDAHTVCKSEAEKYFGKFYSKDEKNGTQKGAPEREVVKKKVKKWKGWKNEIKEAIKDKKEGILIEELRLMLVGRWKECFIKKSFDDRTFGKKLKFSRFVKVGDTVFYYRNIQTSD